MALFSTSWGLPPHNHSEKPESGGPLNEETKMVIGGRLARLRDWLFSLGGRK